MTLPFPDSPNTDENIADSITRIEQNLEYLDSGFSANTKVVYYTADMTTDLGTVAYTGAGVTPKMVIIMARSTSSSSWGVIDENGDEMVMYIPYTDLSATDTAKAVYLEQASGASQTAVVSALTADGVNLTWTKTGSPTGTANIIMFYLG